MPEVYPLNPTGFRGFDESEIQILPDNWFCFGAGSATPQCAGREHLRNRTAKHTKLLRNSIRDGRLRECQNSHSKTLTHTIAGSADVALASFPRSAKAFVSNWHYHRAV